jgi:hypothetical protein
MFSYFNCEFEMEACLSQVYAMTVDTEAEMKPLVFGFLFQCKSALKLHKRI